MSATSPAGAPRFPTLGWALALLGAGAVLVLTASPAWLPDGPAAAVRLGFSFVCHQLPDRSPFVHGHQLALCHRCLGILVGVGLGIAASPVLPSRLADWMHARHPLAALVLAGVPTAVDWLLGATGVWANTPLSRTATGALFGLAAGALVGLSLLLVRPEPVRAASPNLLA